MMSQRGVRLLTAHGLRESLQRAALSTTCANHKSYKLVVVGGGAGGCATAAKFSSKLGKGQVAVIDPANMHYYQPMWTLVGGGMKTLEDSGKPMSEVLPKKADWIKEKVVSFDPHNNKVITNDGQEINYEYLVVALGIQLNFDKIKGLLDALETPGVCSNYSPLFVKRTFKSLKNFKEGNALFTFPNTPIKCAGAPQKIMYISEEYFRKHGKRDKANIVYYTSLPVLFGIKKYADALWEVVKERNITVNLRHNLIEVMPDSKEAVFQNLDKPEEISTVKVSKMNLLLLGVILCIQTSLLYGKSARTKEIEFNHGSIIERIDDVFIMSSNIVIEVDMHAIFLPEDDVLNLKNDLMRFAISLKEMHERNFHANSEISLAQTLSVAEMLSYDIQNKTAEAEELARDLLMCSVRHNTLERRNPLILAGLNILGSVANLGLGISNRLKINNQNKRI